MENMVYTFEQITNLNNCKYLILLCKNKGLETSHNPKVEGSNPSPAPKQIKEIDQLIPEAPGRSGEVEASLPTLSCRPDGNVAGLASGQLSPL
jgi:hypothetical protein